MGDHEPIDARLPVAMVQQARDEAEIPFCFIGSFSAQRYAEPRATRDADVSILTGLGNEASIIDAMFAVFRRCKQVEAASCWSFCPPATLEAPLP